MVFYSSVAGARPYVIAYVTVPSIKKTKRVGTSKEEDSSILDHAVLER